MPYTTKRGNNKADNSEAPKSGSFNTGIKNPTLSDPEQSSYNYGVNNQNLFIWNPTYISGSYFYAAGTTGSYSEDLFDRLVVPLFNNYLQANINFNYQIPKEVLAKTFELYSKALSLYFTIDSILEVHDNPNVQNKGNTTLRLTISADILNLQSELKQRLEFMSIPPNLVKQIHWLYQAYKFSALPGSPIYRFTFGGLFVNFNPDTGLDGVISVDVYRDCFEQLDTISSTLSMLSRMKPEWQIKSLPKSNGTPVEDKQWQTLWVNQGVSGSEVADNTDQRIVLPSVDNEDINIPYLLLTNDLDGGIYALSSIHINQTANVYDLFFPGFFGPFITLEKSDQPNGTYYTNRSTVGDDIYTQASTPDSDMSGSLWSIKYQDPIQGWLQTDSGIAGSQLCQIHTLRNTKSSCTEYIKWLYHLDELLVNTNKVR